MLLASYWGKSISPLEYEWRTNKDSLDVLARRYNMTCPELEKRAKQGRWQHNSSSLARYHLLIWHCLDVAACANAYLKRNQPLLSWFASQLQQSLDTTLQYLTFWVALHDLGKFARAFQSQREDLLPDLWGDQYQQSTLNYSVRHDTLGYWLWKDDAFSAVLGEQLDLEDEYALVQVEPIVRAVTGHHGKPPQPYNGQGSWQIHHAFTKVDVKVAQQFVCVMADLLLVDPQARALLSYVDESHDEKWEKTQRKLSWQLAGLTVLADWLGSNTRFFHYQDSFNPDQVGDPIRHYWEGVAQPCAIQALQHTGAVPNPANIIDTPQQLFPYIQSLSPLQAWATSHHWTAPSLYILEDTMGSGKTEAALLLVAQILQHQPLAGTFLALPTMATANAMYDRMAECYERLFGSVSLVLAHGKSRQVESFRESIVDVLPSDPSHDVLTADEQSASARCQAWLADKGKKSLLAPVGVGTIDQVLLSILHSKHQSIRMLGMFGKILVIDEVHACDTYMLKLLDKVLQHHARHGGSAILLSATLPQRQKQQLIDAYAIGLGKPSKILQSKNYPLATMFNGSTLQEDRIAPKLESQRKIHLSFLDEIEQVYVFIHTQLKLGKNVVWIRNTVKDVVDSAEYLKSQLELNTALLVFHARFTGADRRRKEDTLLKWLGKNSTPEDRKSKLIICSQVAEMSIDFDTDVLISDLAPIDSVLQRAGRLARHVRDEKGNRLLESNVDLRGDKILYIFSPPWTEEPTEDWYSKKFQGAARVYAHHAQLWLGLKMMREAGCINLPQDARDWVENVYSTDIEHFPLHLQKSAEQVEGDQAGQRTTATFSHLKLELGYEQDNEFGANWWEESKACSRLGETTFEVLLIKRLLDERLELWEPAESLDASVLRVAGRLIASSLDSLDLQVFLERFSGAIKWLVPIVLQQDADGLWRGAAKNERQQQMKVTYSSELGLKVERDRSE